MKLNKKIIVISLISIISLSLLSGFAYNILNKSEEIKTNGLISIRNYSYGKWDGSSFKSGVRIIDAANLNDKGTEVLNDGEDYLYPTLTADEKRIIAYSRSGQMIEYDIEKKIKKVLYTFTSNGDEPDYIRIIPNLNQVSFGFRGGIYILNKENKPIKIDDKQRFTDVFWMPDGKQFLFGYGYEIFKYDIASKKQEKVMNGCEYQLSKNANYNAHIEESGDKDLLIIKDNKNNKEYKFKSRVIKDYCFSPDEKCIAIITGAQFGSYTHKVLVWDFKNDRKKTIIPSIPQDASNVVDWK